MGEEVGERDSEERGTAEREGGGEMKKREEREESWVRRRG